VYDNIQYDQHIHHTYNTDREYREEHIPTQGM